MIYSDPRDGSNVDTWKEPWKKLIGLLFHVGRAPAGSGWERVNGPTSAKDLCRTIRARAFKDHIYLGGRTRTMLNTIDPPRCRCGKPGTRRVGPTTFCVSCGPLEQTKAWRERKNQRSSEKSEHWDEVDKQRRRAVASKQYGASMKGGAKA